VMFRKALFTLDGILHDIGAPEFSIESVIGRHILQNWLTAWKSLALPLSFRDWMLLQSSALLFPGRLLLQAAQSYVRKKVPSGNPSSVHEARAKNPVLRQVRRKAVNGNQPGNAGAPVNAAIAEPA
jgi:hypothetical protein